MRIVLPYQDIVLKNCVFTTPNGNFLYLKDIKHEDYAHIYCAYLCLEIMKHINKFPKDKQDLIYDFIKKEHYLENIISNFNIPIENYKQEFEKVYLWKNSKSFNEYEYSDFLVYILGFDKFNAMFKTMNKIILTTDNNPYFRFYNYCLMDFVIERYSKKEYNENKFDFVFKDKEILTLDSSYEDEISEIKEKVLKKDRQLFFK